MLNNQREGETGEDCCDHHKRCLGFHWVEFRSGYRMYTSYANYIQILHTVKTYVL